jgi:NADH:ubiquinone oxidoreductase subunit C
LVLNLYFFFVSEVKYFFFNYLFITSFLYHNYVVQVLSFFIINLIFERYLTVCLINYKTLFFNVKIFKNHIFFKFSQLVDLFSVDLLKSDYRFILGYIFLSFSFKTKLILKTILNENNLIPTVTLFYKNANWLEREVWDLFGIFFFNNKDLRRILTDYTFWGFPLRKDFPLTGYYEVFFDEFLQRIIKLKISFQQLYRVFFFFKTW